ncbi:hypothetical protein M900_0856 [Bacteriovorax sp. Seq25_V]|nr:hypothetical protein M900_0856 [Bacteriovorax sp. Seq25_V]
MNNILLTTSLIFCFSTSADLIGHHKESVKSITIPETGLVLSSDTILRANVINLNGKIETLGHKLFIDAQNLNIGSKGKIIGFSNPAEGQVLIPESITHVPSKAGRSGDHGATGAQGLKGHNGYEGTDARQDSRSVTVYAKEIKGHLYIDGNGQEGGAGGRGGKGGRGGDGGDGRAGHVKAKWDHCAERRNGGNAGRGGAPGLGGDGGKGGRGGNNIEVILRSDDISKELVSITSLPGAGGKGGMSGEYGEPGQAGGPGKGGNDSFTFGFKVRDCDTNGGSNSTAGSINESEAQRLARTGKAGEKSQVGIKKINSLSAKELSNLKGSLENNIIKFHLSRLFHKNKLELYSYLAGRVEFSIDGFDKDLLESLMLADKEVVVEFKNFLETKLLTEVDQRLSKALKEFKNDIHEIVSILNLVEKSEIEEAHEKILSQVKNDEKKLSSKVEDLIVECLDYRDVSSFYYDEMTPGFAKVPSCEVGGLTNLRKDFFAKLEINQSYKPTVFPNSLIELLKIEEVASSSRNPAQTIIDTIIINNQKLKASNFKEALNINKDSFTVTSYEVSKKNKLNLSEIITNFKIALAALEVLGE